MADVTTDGTLTEAGSTRRLPPKELQKSWQHWARDNLFSSPFNGALTVLFGAAIFVSIRGLLNFTFSHERSWDAVATNLRLLFTAAYPSAQYSRIWVCVGTLAVLTAMTLAAYNIKGRVRVHMLAERAIMMGGVIIACGLLAPFSTSALVWYVVIGAVILGVGVFLRSTIDEDATLSLLLVVATAIGLPILSLWVLPYGHHALVNGEVIAESGTVARTTSGPWTIIFVLAVAVFVVMSRFIPVATRARLRTPVVGLWLMSPLVLVFIVVRDPDFDYGHILTTEIPMFLAYAIGGGALLFWLTKPGVGEIGRIAAAVTLFIGFATFMTPMLQVIRLLMLTLALFALAAPTFAGELRARRKYVLGWVMTALVMVWLITAANSPSTVETFGDWFPGGFSVTLMVATFTLIMSFPLGVILALARTSRMPIFRVMSTFYIEVVRGVPFITVLIFFVIMVPLFLPTNMELSNIAAVVIAYSLFSAAYLAENVRGGLQSIRRGQHEAAEALGMTGMQKTVFIVLPQALRASIPPLVGQTIGTFKETSLLAIIGVFDFLFVARTLIPTQTAFLGSLKEGLLVVSLVYWFFTYNMSKASQRIEQRLGVGER